MEPLFISQVGHPNLFEIHGLLFGILLACWFLEAVYRWFTRIPCPEKLPPPRFRSRAAKQAMHA